MCVKSIPMEPRGQVLSEGPRGAALALCDQCTATAFSSGPKSRYFHLTPASGRQFSVVALGHSQQSQRSCTFYSIFFHRRHKKKKQRIPGRGLHFYSRKKVKTKNVKTERDTLRYCLIPSPRVATSETPQTPARPARPKPRAPRHPRGSARNMTLR